MKVVSASLYGRNPFYVDSGERFVEDVIAMYPGWTCRLYVGDSVPLPTLKNMADKGAEIVRVKGREDPSAMMWRFAAVADPAVSTVMVRDIDSRILRRETSAVAHWLQSSLQFHIMRDHPFHLVEMLGGMWGVHCSSDIAPLFRTCLEPPAMAHGDDQRWLAEVVYPVARSNSLVHDSFFTLEWARKRFPTSREGLEFVGEPVAPDGCVDAKYRNVLRKWMNQPWRGMHASVRWHWGRMRRYGLFAHDRK